MQPLDVREDIGIGLASVEQSEFMAMMDRGKSKVFAQKHRAAQD